MDGISFCDIFLNPWFLLPLSMLESNVQCSKPISARSHQHVALPVLSFHLEHSPPSPPRQAPSADRWGWGGSVLQPPAALPSTCYTRHCRCPAAGLRPARGRDSAQRMLSVLPTPVPSSSIGRSVSAPRPALPIRTLTATACDPHPPHGEPSPEALRGSAMFGCRQIPENGQP